MIFEAHNLSKLLRLCIEADGLISSLSFEDMGYDHFISILKFSKFLETSMKYLEQFDVSFYPT